MAIRYRKVQNKLNNSPTFGKWYARAVVLDTIDTKRLAEEISHSTTVTYADVMAVLWEVSVAMKTHLLNSQRVVLDGIGAFKVGISSKPSDTAADCDGTKITNFRILYKPESTFNATGVNAKGHRTGIYIKNLLEGVTTKETPKNTVKDAKPQPGGKTENGGKTEGQG